MRALRSARTSQIAYVLHRYQSPPVRHHAGSGLVVIVALVALFALFAGGCATSPTASPAAAPAAAGTSFAGPADFSGGFDARLSNAANGGQTSYEGEVLVAMLDRTLVANTLPADLQLASPLAASTRHPVMVMTGNQRDPKLLVGGIEVGDPSLHDYREMMLLVPFVVHRTGSNRWHTFVVRMYLDDPGAVAIGNTVFGYAKELGELIELGTVPDVKTDVFDARKQMMFASAVRSTGPWQPASAATSVPRWTDVQEILKMPIVGNIPILGLVCSYWEWSYAGAEAAPATGTLRFLRPFQPTMTDWPALGTVAATDDGAIAIRRVRWRLATIPPACRF
jgi:hypothetical protein